MIELVWTTRGFEARLDNGSLLASVQVGDAYGTFHAHIREMYGRLFGEHGWMPTGNYTAMGHVMCLMLVYRHEQTPKAGHVDVSCDDLTTVRTALGLPGGKGEEHKITENSVAAHKAHFFGASVCKAVFGGKDSKVPDGKNVGLRWTPPSLKNERIRLEPETARLIQDALEAGVGQGDGIQLVDDLDKKIGDQISASLRSLGDDHKGKYVVITVLGRLGGQIKEFVGQSTGLLASKLTEEVFKKASETLGVFVRVLVDTLDFDEEEKLRTWGPTLERLADRRIRIGVEVRIYPKGSGSTLRGVVIDTAGSLSKINGQMKFDNIRPAIVYFGPTIPPTMGGPDDLLRKYVGLPAGHTAVQREVQKYFALGLRWIFESYWGTEKQTIVAAGWRPVAGAPRQDGLRAALDQESKPSGEEQPQGGQLRKLSYSKPRKRSGAKRRRGRK